MNLSPCPGGRSTGQTGRIIAAALAALWWSFGGIGIYAPAAAAEFSFRLVGSDPASGADASISPDGTMIATSSRRGGHKNIWIYTIGAGAWRQLTEGDTDDGDPAWSPDGTLIAFKTFRNGMKGIWTVRVADHVLTRLVSSADDVDYPSWSPDQSLIEYTGGPWKSRNFMLVASQGGTPRTITKKPGHLGACSFYPDGKSLVCHTYENSRGNVMRLSLDGEIIDRLTNGGALDYKPHVSPDGKAVAFSRIQEGSSVIWLSPANSQHPTRMSAALTQPQGEDRWPMYTRNGSQMFFHRVVDQGTAIMVFHRDTKALETLVPKDEKPGQAAFDSKARRVAYCAHDGARSVVRILDRLTGSRRTLDTGADEACYPRWSPNDEQIAFNRKVDGTWQIAVVGADGSAPRLLTAQSSLRGMDGPLDWSPDGSRILFKAETAPYETALLTVDLQSGHLERLTTGQNFYEAPAWYPDGQQIAFMESRSGEWLWGLFRESLQGHTVTDITTSDSTVKNYPRVLPDGRIIWMQSDRCDATEFVAERLPNGQETLLTELPGGHWPSFSQDGKQILFTVVLHTVEFYLGDRNSPNG